MRYLIKYLIDAAALALLYAFVLFPRWRTRGRDILLVNTLMYAYLSLVLYVTLMPVITSVPFILDHPYQPMNLTPFIDVSMGRGDSLRQVVLNLVMTMPFGFLFPLTRNRTAGHILDPGPFEKGGSAARLTPHQKERLSRRIDALSFWPRLPA